MLRERLRSRVRAGSAPDPAVVQPELHSVAGTSIVIPVGKRSHLVSYCIENPEHGTACAFVQVTVGDPNDAPPGRGDRQRERERRARASPSTSPPTTRTRPARALRVTTIVSFALGFRAGRRGPERDVHSVDQRARLRHRRLPGDRRHPFRRRDLLRHRQRQSAPGARGERDPGASRSPRGGVAERTLVGGSSKAARHRYEVLSRQLPAGVSAELSGDTLTVSASPDAIGRTGSVVLRASKGGALVTLRRCSRSS